MKKTLNFCLACLFAIGLPSVGFPQIELDDNEVQITNTAITALQKSYGNVIATEEANSQISLTLSVPYTEIKSMLTKVTESGWYPCNLSIMGAGPQKAAIALMITQQENDSARHFDVLQKLSAPDVLPWKNGKIDNKFAYVTILETDFGKDFIVKGETLKSDLIFKELSPRIEAIGADNDNLDSDRFSNRKQFDPSKIFTRETYRDNDTGIKGSPFFERGTFYEDEEIGRYMVFTLRCQW